MAGSTTPGIVIENLAEFRRALKSAASAQPRVLTAGLKVAGAPALAKAKASAPTLTGFLASSYKLSVRGTEANIVNAAPYSAGAEWGMGGKWKGFRKYPPAPGDSRGRFAWRGIVEETDEIMRLIAATLADIVELYGWASS